jgi:hypothetical protein
MRYAFAAEHFERAEQERFVNFTITVQIFFFLIRNEEMLERSCLMKGKRNNNRNSF